MLGGAREPAGVSDCRLVGRFRNHTLSTTLGPPSRGIILNRLRERDEGRADHRRQTACLGPQISPKLWISPCSFVTIFRP